LEKEAVMNKSDSGVVQKKRRGGHQGKGNGVDVEEPLPKKRTRDLPKTEIYLVRGGKLGLGERPGKT